MGRPNGLTISKEVLFRSVQLPWPIAPILVFFQQIFVSPERPLQSKGFSRWNSGFPHLAGDSPTRDPLHQDLLKRNAHFLVGFELHVKTKKNSGDDDRYLRILQSHRHPNKILNWTCAVLWNNWVWQVTMAAQEIRHRCKNQRLGSNTFYE